MANALSTIRTASRALRSTPDHVAPERSVCITESEAAALSSFMRYSAEMGDILRELLPGIEQQDRALAAQVYALTQESKLALFCALARLRREADAARAVMNAEVSHA